MTFSFCFLDLTGKGNDFSFWPGRLLPYPFFQTRTVPWDWHWIGLLWSWRLFDMWIVKTIKILRGVYYLTFSMWKQWSSKVNAFSFCFQTGSLKVLSLDGLCTQESHLRGRMGRHLFTCPWFLLRHHVEQVKTSFKFSYLLPSKFSPKIVKQHINLYDNAWFKDSFEAFFFKWTFNKLLKKMLLWY